VRSRWRPTRTHLVLVLVLPGLILAVALLAPKLLVALVVLLLDIGAFSIGAAIWGRCWPYG